jgi:uncharacterized membrane protein YcaP (DUF421 family)
MDTVVRAAVVYVVLLLIFRIAGKHSLAEITTFDLVLTLIISEAIQQGMVDEDRSLTGAFLLVVTLVGIDILLAALKQRFSGLAKILEGTPVLVLKDGRVRRQAADKERVDESDILAAARRDHGLHRLDEIDYAVMERTGSLSIIPKKGRAS